MNQYLQFEKSNYLSPYLFYNHFLYWVTRLHPFVSPKGKPPMDSKGFVNAYRVQYGSGLRITELISLRVADVDLNNRILTIQKAKTGKHFGKMRADGTVIEEYIPQKATILPFDIYMLEEHMKTLSKKDLLFPANRHIMWQYARDAGNYAGLQIGEVQRVKVINNVWTHLMRKSCSKRMQELGASRELRMLKLRHAMKDAHDAYDMPDINTLLRWENQQFDPSVMIEKERLR